LKKSHILILVVLGVLILDQALKIYVKTSFSIGDGFKMFGLDWAQILFIENDGMAFGITFGGKCLGSIGADGGCNGILISPTAGKLTLSLFRIVMVAFLIYFIRELHKAKESLGLLICLSLILAGAIGNILDSMFYGLIFNEPLYHEGIAEFMSPDRGYAPFLHGRVVDMFYFPMVDTHYPSWFFDRPEIKPGWMPKFLYNLMPWAGERFQFFRPIFNLADAAISVGVGGIILFHRSFLKKSVVDKEKQQEATVTTSEDTTSESPKS